MTLPMTLRTPTSNPPFMSSCMIFIAAALDCSAKTRAREIPKNLGDGKPMPVPLRSGIQKGFRTYPSKTRRATSSWMSCGSCRTEVRENPDAASIESFSKRSRCGRQELDSVPSMALVCLWERTANRNVFGAAWKK